MHTREEIKQMENDTYSFLFSKKKNIRSIIKKYSNLREVFDLIEDVFQDEYLELYPNNFCIFNAVNESEFFDWCRNNIDGFIGNEVDKDPEYWCGIKE